MKNRADIIGNLQRILPETDIIRGGSVPFLPQKIDRKWRSHRQLDYIANMYMKRAGVTFKHNRRNLCQFQIEEDLITIPYKNRFESMERYYGTLMHELIHSTGARNRLDRVYSGMCRSTEEMTAEIGSMLLLAARGVDSIRYSAPYVKTWMHTGSFFGMYYTVNDEEVHSQRLNKAICDANQAVDYILNIVASDL